MANYNIKITKSKFDAIHILCDSEMPRVEVAKYLKLSSASVTEVMKFSTYEEYQQQRAVHALNKRKAYARKKNAEQNAEYRNAKDEKNEQEQPDHAVESRQTVIVQASHYMLAEQKRTNELLESISNKLAFIVEELTGTSDTNTKGGESA